MAATQTSPPTAARPAARVRDVTPTAVVADLLASLPVPGSRVPA
jgi:hypothetical protein